MCCLWDTLQADDGCDSSMQIVGIQVWFQQIVGKQIVGFQPLKEGEVKGPPQTQVRQLAHQEAVLHVDLVVQADGTCGESGNSK